MAGIRSRPLTESIIGAKQFWNINENSQSNTTLFVAHFTCPKKWFTSFPHTEWTIYIYNLNKHEA